MPKLVALIAFAVAAVLLAAGCDGGMEDAEPGQSPAPTEASPEPAAAEPAAPRPGEWTASTDFGELAFTVNPDGTGISTISFRFSNFECGPAAVSGGVSVKNPSLWTISDGQFTAEVPLSEFDTFTVVGEFGETGTDASGTWEAQSGGTTCSGSWESR